MVKHKNKQPPIVKRPTPPASVQSVEFGAMQVGPLPPAREFGEYEQALPGAADRILTIAEKSFEADTEIQKKLVENKHKVDIASIRYGAINLWAILVLAAIVSVLLLVFEQYIFGGAIGSVGIIIIVIRFVYDVYRDIANRNRKQR